MTEIYCTRLRRVVDVDHELWYKYSLSIAELCHEILERHARGIEFREHYAGDKLDHAMSPHGFDIQCGVHRDTGLVYGGNVFNCGTWMGKLATPHDGTLRPINGLVMSR
jgi:glycogen debranching enzyme